MPDIDTHIVDMILADLPYGVTRNKKDIMIPFELLWKNYNRIIKPNGCIALFAQGMFAHKLALSNEKMYRYDLIWKKGERVTGFLNAKKQILRNHEQILIFYKKQPTYHPQFTEGTPQHSKGNAFSFKEGKNQNYGYFDSKIPDIRKGTTQKYPKSVLNFEKPWPPVHRTQKPVKLCEWLILTFTNPGELVLDNTCGIGTTCIAAKNTGRNFIGIENDEEFYNMDYYHLL
jgi:DNA modification methylase